MRYSILVFAILCGALAASQDEPTTVVDYPEENSTKPESTTVKTNTTSSPETTTSKPTTTKATTTPTPPDSAETVNNYTYYSNNTACLMAKFSAHFEKGKEIWNVTKDAKVDNKTSKCGDLSVKFGDRSFAIVFNQTKKKAFYISQVYAYLGEGVTPHAENLALAKASNGSSYMCTSGISIDLSQNVTLKMKDVQLQAFYVKDGKFATAQKCDSDLSPLVPIIVGAVLAGLIIIVVVAYFIGRRRNRTGYEEI